jgi:hypothetical protein
MGGASRTEEQQQQQQSKKQGSVKQQQQQPQRTLWTPTGKVSSSAEAVAGKRLTSSEQPVTRPTRDSSVETADRRGRHQQQQQPITCQVGSAVSNKGAFLLLSQVS